MRLRVAVVASLFCLWGDFIRRLPTGHRASCLSCIPVNSTSADVSPHPKPHRMATIFCVSGIFRAARIEGTSLGGLNVALLETSDQNLATREAQPSESMIYLPQSADSVQTEALVQWLKATNPELSDAILCTRTVPMKFAHTGSAVSFSAGNFIEIETNHSSPVALSVAANRSGTRLVRR